MGYILIFLVIIGIISSVITSIGNLAHSIFTLSFLPNAIGIFDGEISTRATSIPILSNIIETTLNYISVLFINIIDAILWFVYWIPGVKQVIDVIYTSPDVVEKLIPDMLDSHRNFITHSVLNPVFLVFIIVSFTISKILKNTEIGEIIAAILMIIGFVFACHLLADSMPKSWVGFSNIKVQIYTTFFTLPPFLSKLWLYINVFLCIKLTYKSTGMIENK